MGETGTVEAVEDPVENVERAYEAIAAADREEVWIELSDREDLLAQARDVQQRRGAGAELPLAGRTVAVKDNIDVAGMPTTAACPQFSYLPARDAPVIAGLRAAGALILGKTNMDQFATGLVGTRSPYGAVRDARDPARVSGGSSSGSAVAVALGMADIGVGTDTAGSGRVPAAFQGIFGVKPTQGLLGTEGVVPAARSFDCVSLFSARLGLAEAALGVLLAPGAPRHGAWPSGNPVGAPERPRIAIAARSQLGDLSPDAERAWDSICDAVRRAGARLTEIDMTAFWRAGTLLYDGAFIAERYTVLGQFIAEHRAAVDPSVAAIILGAEETTAMQYLTDLEELQTLRLACGAALEGFDALLLPTTPFQPTIAAVNERPIELNHALGRYTTFCNPLGMCAVAMPAGEADGGQFGVSLLAPAFHDRVVLDLAARWGESAPSPQPRIVGPPSMALLVVGAHLSGQPLHHELIDRGAVLIGPARTSSDYRLYRLSTSPAKPGLIRCSPGEQGAEIEGELWALSPGALADLLERLPRPMTFGHVELRDGVQVLGFLCEPEAIGGAQEITEFRGWLSYLDAASA